MDASATLVGIVGYSPVVESFPLGPRLMAALTRELGGLPRARVENMTWSPIHIVQQFQDEGAERPDRLILIGAASGTRTPGEVRAFRWTGGTLPEAVVQARVYEAVTGVVDLENTLMIGQYFRVWPAETYSVEVDMPADTFGRLVIAASEGWGDDAALRDHLGFSPARTTGQVASVAGALARSGRAAAISVREKSAAALLPVKPFIRNFMREPDAAAGSGSRP